MSDRNYKWVPTVVRLRVLERCCLALLVFLGGCQGTPSASPSATSAPPAAESSANDHLYPREQTVDGLQVTIHAPQIRSWPDFKHFEALVAVEVAAPGGEPAYGSASVSGATEIDMDAGLVRIKSPQVDNLKFASEVPDEYRYAVVHATRSQFDIPLELFLAYLEDDVLAEPPPAGFNQAPPPIEVRSTPTLLLFVNDEPVAAPVEGTGLEVIVNASWPLFRSSGDTAAYYLLEQGRWLSSPTLDGNWGAATSLPADFSRLPDDPRYSAAKQAVPPPAASSPVPAVLFVTTPTELIVTEGEPQLEAVPDAGALQYVVNTGSPLFHLGDDWYYLASGRWFATTQLETGPWRWVAELPEAFSRIPEEHELALVRASVPGTPEARMAALEAMLPTTVSATRGSAAPVEVTYAGDPEFEAIAGTEVARAVNSGFDVLRYQQHYYLLYRGIWYVGDNANGPWGATDEVPDAIYQIPSESPSYPVTQVTASPTTGSTVQYSYPASYSSNLYVVYGVPWYGTGWYYPPYYWYPYYYPYPPSYGHGSWYNPNTGGYGSRSVWYGPYGGYSYNQGYNPTTGRYGFVETAWDGNEWASHGETDNPRTGVRTQTDRYYNDKKDRAEMQRRVERGDAWVETDRKTDFDNNTIDVNRKTSQGGSSQMTRTLEDGTLSSSGTVTTGDGRSYTVSGDATREGGSTVISGEDGSAQINTRRDDGRSVSTIEGSGGGQGVSVSGEGPGRATIGKSGSGDIYAGRDGNVYKKTDSGWQHYEGGDWRSVDVPAQADSLREETVQPRRTDTGTSAQRDAAMAAQARPAQQRPSSMDNARLQRDYTARQRANRSYQMRRGSYGGMGGGLRGGGFRGRR